MLFNPYRPGAGMLPAYLAGRDNIIKEAQNILQSISYSYSTRSVVYYGLRGVGKTVLLNYIENLAAEMDLPSEYMEIDESVRSFEYQIALHIYKLINRLSVRKKNQKLYKKALSILKAFILKYSFDDIGIAIEPANGISDTGNLANDMTELFLALGIIAKKQNKGVILFIDEFQYIKDDEFSALMEALHRTNQKNYPVAIFSAGLPKSAKIVVETKSYAERLFDFIEIKSLNDEEAKLALIEPAKKFKINYTEEAINKIIEITQGYPYFLQEYGKWVWEYKQEKTVIDIQIVNKAYNQFEKSLDKALFKVRHDRATVREIEFMTAMVACKKLPCLTKEIASIMGESIQAISPLRAKLIHKGFIYAAKRGEVDFTVPQFD